MNISVRLRKGEIGSIWGIVVVVRRLLGDLDSCASRTTQGFFQLVSILFFV